MDIEIIYSLIGILGFALVIYYTLRATPKGAGEKTEAKKKEEVIAEYKQKLEAALEEFADKQELRVKQKNVLLKQYSDEFSRNIFFNDDEVKEIILELSKI